MNIWANAVVTNKGLALQSKLISGTALTITKAVTGAGTVDANMLKEQTAVANQKQTMTFRPVSYPETGKCSVPVYLTNESLTTGYTIMQIGIYAQDPDEGEILYFVCQAEVGTGTPVPSVYENPGYSAEWTFYFRYGQADNVTVTVDPANTVNTAQVQQMIAEAVAKIPTPDVSGQIGDHNNDKSAHTDIRNAVYDAKRSASQALSEAKDYTDRRISAIPTPDVSGEINAHNADSSAHADIRNAVSNAVSKSGDTMNGDLKVERASFPSVRLTNTGNGSGAVFQQGANQTTIANYNVSGDDQNCRLLSINNSTLFGLDSALRITDRVNGSDTQYNVLHAGNKNLIFTYGTEDLVAGETPLGTGMLHFVYE